MSIVRRRPWLVTLALVVIVVALIAGSFGIYLAGTAGQLPWQEDPTRIPITPFADIPGFGAPAASSTEPVGTPSPDADSTPDDTSSRESSDAGVVMRSDGHQSSVSGATWRR
jgi:hypothetical protein